MPHNEYDDEQDVPEIVVIRHEGVLGIVVEPGPHVSTVLYFVAGLMFEEIMENEDFYTLEVED